ncbi:hypothetical protein [Aminobacter sp. MDW-2]|uniref:hypothetical protein n=1 Tax=Aminobacter sp. MDW-2 TaxID=2666139 RepID=UPI0012AF139A|nr:hypothetical protein [Aminobacter sp. MDW-2]MRX31902.1 hypothetical protein [Aminobacter sp. MDW-2]QNH32376.1 hypothetical protein H5P29_17650 [Aminobacter sp. MDW-2]
MSDMVERVARAIKRFETRRDAELSVDGPWREFELDKAREAIEAISQTAPDAWRYRFDGGKWTVQKNKPSWHREFMADVVLEPLFSIDAALKGEAEWTQRCGHPKALIFDRIDGEVKPIIDFFVTSQCDLLKRFEPKGQ